MTSQAELMIAFLAAANGRLTPKLMKYTAELDGDAIKARIVVLDEIDEDELDTIFDILGDTVGHTGGTASFELVRATSIAKADADPELPVKLFRAYAIDAANRA